LIGLGIDHGEFFIVEHQLLDVGQGDVRTRLRVVQAAVRIFLDQAF
jgi:hypothetical protein